MNRIITSFFGAGFLVIGLLLGGCDSNDEEPIVAETVTDLPADPPTGRDPNTGQTIGTTDRFTFFSLRTNQIILGRDSDDRSDSTSTNWDLAFRSTTILVNGNNSWGGQGGALVLNQEFESVTQAPSSGYTTDPIGLESAGDPAWGLYDPPSMTVFPLAGKTLIVKTADGRYAKLRFRSYYRGAPEVPNPFQDAERYYTFDFVFQPDGSRDF